MGDLLDRKPLGGTGLQVSRLCYGTLALGPYHANINIEDGSNLLVKAYEMGINFWDTAQLYETYPMIREAKKKLNNPTDLIIASRTYGRSKIEMQEAIEQARKELDEPALKMFGIHELSDRKDFEESKGALEALREAKEKGHVQNISVSMHAIEAVHICADLDYVDILFPMYNKTGLGIIDGGLKEMSQAIEKARNKGKGIYAMKVLGGGHLAGSAIEAIQFAMKNPHIDAIAIGMDNEAELNLNCAIFREQQELIDIYVKKVKTFKKVIHVDPWCEGCQECIKICPNNAITLEFSQAKVDPEKCVLCGYCASACKLFCLKVVNIQ